MFEAYRSTTGRGLLRARSYHNETLNTLLAALAEHVIAPAEQRANEIAPPKR